jgi:flagellar hook-associated protein 2
MVMRISGLGSGMDIDGMVSKLMQAERIPLDNLNKTDQKLSWKSQAYRDINVKISAFRDSLLSLRFGSNWAKTTSSSSDTTKVDVSSVGTAATGTHTIIVTGLAQGASTASISTINTNASLVGTTNLSSGLNIASTSNNNKFNLTLNGTTKTVTIADGYYADNNALGAAIQSAVDQSFGANQVKVDISSGIMQLSPLGDPNYLPQLKISSVTGNSAVTDLGFTDNQSFKFDNTALFSNQTSKLGGVDLTGTSFVINGQTIDITATDSLNSIISKVNNSAVGVNMYYDSVTDKISVTSKSTGDTAKIVFGGGTFLTIFNLDNANVTQGKNAQVKIDGVVGTYATNQITSNGVTYTLHNTTDPINGVTVNVNQDTDSIYNSITDFVNKYNDLLGSLNSKLNEPVYRSYQPLTDDQKKAMTETDISNWEDKAKSGLLTRDNNLAQLRNNIRQIAYSSVSTLPTDKNALYKIGITGQTYTKGDYSNAGKLQIDASKLKDAISKDPQGVINLFTNQPASGTANEQGVFQQLYDTSNNTISSILNTAGGGIDAFDNVTNSLGNQIHTINVKISALQDKLTTKENFYYSMFSKMDTAIANSNSQISWIQSQMQ